ncbi:hypothetical protein K493DRAFT_333671 [Basidiobolus meristosporus CBS 931.73]|uniref:Ubiquitin-like-conjugating enzyme ATG10 n=1 Tax=Basidiobolus meristosporus CBS 931.73 TaxID=1314790 RepID=A0A1Y1Z4E2_9FUNG|nr:hypothetical protein K493DRAFT_333671 [Basidiobolus meristosporus CBS 931.73]|eukprot:ORY05120.1 hypothetical protein K493DRAFT_333671 [Basidiobolus meristosporus CBS 931.73]
MIALTRCQFELACKEFLACSKKLGDGSWRWREQSEPYVKIGYLEHRKSVCIPSEVASQELAEFPELELEEEDAGCFVANSEEGKSRWNLEYNILYSAAYQVPEIFVRGWNDEGSYLMDSQILQLTSVHLRDDLRKVEFGGGLTCMEHPILRTPFYRLHPCETANVMREVAGEELLVEDYIPMYINLIGPSVGLSLPLKYFT